MKMDPEKGVASPCAWGPTHESVVRCLCMGVYLHRCFRLRAGLFCFCYLCVCGLSFSFVDIRVTPFSSPYEGVSLFLADLGFVCSLFSL